MHIASQNIQCKVQRMTDQEDDKEEDQVIRNAANGVEHRCDNTACQHQSHDTGVGQDISEPSGNGVIQR